MNGDEFLEMMSDTTFGNVAPGDTVTNPIDCVTRGIVVAVSDGGALVSWSGQPDDWERYFDAM